MLLLSSPRRGRHSRASLPLPPPPLLLPLLLCVVSVTAGLPAGVTCPRALDCARQGRDFCEPGTGRCGPCLASLQENEEGRCVKTKRHQQHVSYYPDLDEEIDFLQAVLEKQEVSESKAPDKPSKHSDAPPPKQEQKSSAGKPSATTAAPDLIVPNATTTDPRVTGGEDRVGPIMVSPSTNDKMIIILISVFVLLGTVAMLLAMICVVKLQKESRLAQKVDYPAFSAASVQGDTVNGASMGDKTLAHNAQMYHYQHQKQQMLSMGNQKQEPKVVDSEPTSDEEEVGGDFTVYECPGLAPTGEMEVKNPLFDDSAIPYQGNHK